MPNVKPISDYVMIEEEPIDEYASEGGLLTPHFLKRDHYEGEVVATGPGRMKRKKGKYRRKKMDLKVGDWVVIPHGVGHLVKMGGKYYWFVREHDILWKEEEE